MKTFNKVILYIFSFIMLVISCVAIALCLKWISPSVITNAVTFVIQHQGVRNVFLAFNVVFVLLGLKALFINERTDESQSGHGVLLENQNGKLMISKETIEDIVNSVVSTTAGAQETNVNVVLTSANTVDIYVTLTVGVNTNIKELSSMLQTKIKEKVKKITDIEINEVNIKIKNITPAQDENV